MAKFTKKAIIDCFLNMLKHKNIDRITVTDICHMIKTLLSVFLSHLMQRLIQ